MASTAVQPQPAPRGPAHSPAQAQSDILPSLFGGGYGTYEVRPSNYLLSFVLHCLAVAIIILVATYINSHRAQIAQQVQGTIIDISPYILPPGTQSGGGGGGGAHDKLLAEKGALPKPARDQFTPPTVIVQNQPKLPIEPTVVAPEIKLKPASIGDPLAALNSIPSNGIGGNAGIGNGDGTGIGSGRGPGMGPGWGGGVGGGAYRIGGGVSAPIPIYQPDPEYSEEARKAKYQGTVILWMVIGSDGRVHEAKVVRSLGLGLDEKALEAVKTWKFEPAKKDGQAVSVQLNVEVNFRLY
jgi:TonB family protein